MEASDELAGRLEGIGRLVGIERIFGKPERVGDRTLIPVAAVSWSGGMGYGRGNYPKKDGSADAQPAGPGGGGGGKVKLRPVALVEVTEAGTRVVPIIDRTRLLLAGMVLVAWNLFWVAYTVRRIVRRRR
jgi:uncharacterized spore protein YtfJ